MKISILQHVPFEGPGMIMDWINNRGHEVSIYQVWLGDLPQIGSFDLLIILGGPMSANDEFDWLKKEQHLIKQTIDGGCLVFGICLGAQIIARVLGGKITKNDEKEIGWFPIECANNFLKKDLNVFHWHGETFSLPEGADLLASSAACQNQAFAYNDSVLALQFHLEMDEKSIDLIIKNCSDDLKKGKYVQSADEIRVAEDNIKVCREELFDLLDGFEISKLGTAS